MKNEKGQAIVLFLFVAALVVAVALWAISTSTHAPAMGEAIEEGIRSAEQLVDDIPITNHAATSHSDQYWNATSIKSFFDSGNCPVKSYTCELDDFEVRYCVMNDEKSIGLIIGLTVKQIISGFMADTDYWLDRCTQ